MYKNIHLKWDVYFTFNISIRIVIQNCWVQIEDLKTELVMKLNYLSAFYALYQKQFFLLFCHNLR